MPQDFVDAVNAAVLGVNPDAGMMVSGSMTLGTDFDEWLGPKAMMKYGLDPLPPEVAAAFDAKFAEKREALKASVVATAVETEKKRMAGTLEDFSFNDSYRLKPR
jgi:hypothetical protein